MKSTQAKIPIPLKINIGSVFNSKVLKKIPIESNL